MPVNNYIPRISIVTGVVNSRDAVSETVIADMEAIDGISRQLRRNIDVRIFCTESDHPDCRVKVLSDWYDAFSDEHFLTSDLYYFHYAIHNDIHNLMYRLRRDARSIVFFHNVTPPQFCPPKAETLIHKSYQQIRNFRTADLIITPSRFSAQQLMGYGLDRDVRVVPLFGANGPEEVGPSSDPFHQGPFRLLYCGRFVPSKGVETLLAAVDAISAKLTRPVELTLAGSRQFSDVSYLRRLQEKAGQLSGQATARFVFDLDAATLKKVFAESDAFVLPSFHEGFGMPVAEALMAGTPVICSNAAALPEIAGDCALTVPPGDAATLGGSLLAFIEQWARGNVLVDQGALPHGEWDKRRMAHATTFLRSSYIDRIGTEFAALLQPTASWSADARQALSDAQLVAADRVLADPIDSAVMGDVLAQRILRAVEDGPTAMRRLLSIAFNGIQSDADVDYWLKFVSENGVHGLIKHLVNVKELRHSRERLQASVFLRAQLVANDIDGMLAKKAAKELSDERDYVRAKLKLLAGNGNQGDHEFLHDALALLHDVDPEDARINGLRERLTDGVLSRAAAAELLASLFLNDDEQKEASTRRYPLPASWRTQAGPEHSDIREHSRWEGSSHLDANGSPEIARLIADLRYAEFEAEALKREIVARRVTERFFWRPLRRARDFASFARGMTGPARKFINEGDRARERRDWEAAARHYALAVQKSPRLGHIWIQLGHMRKEMNQLEEAKAAYEQALALMPLNSDAHLQMGHLHKVMGDQRRATDYYWKSLFYDPDNSNAIQELRGQGFAEDLKRVKSRLRDRQLAD